MQGCYERSYSPTENAYLYTAAAIALQVRAVCTTTTNPVFGPVSSIESPIRLRISSPRHRLSHGLFHRTLKISARSLAHAKRTVTRGPLRPGFHALLTIFLDPQHVFLYIVLSTVLYLAVRVTGLRSVMRAHELQRHA